jgi:hypothetical protein
MNPEFAPTASAIPGLPIHNMSNVIDSLKRLERAGSEHSKTTEKLVAAARELSELIARQFLPPKGELIPVVNASLDSAEGWVRGRNIIDSHPPGCRFVSYFAGQDEAGRPALWLQPWGWAVSQPIATRDTALAFSRDVADGILDLFCQRLEEMQAESAQGLPPIESVLAKLRAAG